MSNFLLREIQPSDFHKGYLVLLQTFANYYPLVTETQFSTYLTTHPTTKIVVIENTSGQAETNKIIGAGTVLCIEKLHNPENRMGFIQDVVVHPDYRKKGYGKLLVVKLYEVGIANRCYKIILNCNPDVEQFYTKLGFTKKGFEFDKRTN